MNKTQFHTLAKLYGQRYGTFTMQNETIEMWWSKLKNLDHDQVREVFHQLLGEKEKPWGWGKVFEMIEARFPPEGESFTLEREWRDNPKTANMQEKQREFGAYMRGLVAEIEKRKKRKEKPFDWLPTCAHKFVEVMGRGEARSVVEKIQRESGETPHENQFVSLVLKELR